jgi:hypothetical protein
LAKERAAADAEEGRWLLCALRSAAHVHLGFGSFGEYVERLFGYKPRSTQEKLRVAEALEALPAMGRSLESGSLSWSAVRELTRVAVAETEERWLEVAAGKTVRQLQRLVEGKRPGDDPGASRPLLERRHVLRFEVEPETFALFREAMTELRRRTGSLLDDDSALLSMARHVLGGPGVGVQSLLPRPTTRAKQTIPPALRRAVLRRDHERCQVPGCTHATFLDLHHIIPRSEGGQHELENLITICGAHHRAAHRGGILIRGSATKPHFRHADGSEYGHGNRPHTIAAQTQVFSALRHLGFRERDVHTVLEELRKQNDLGETSKERLLRGALQRLAPPRVKPTRI